MTKSRKKNSPRVIWTAKQVAALRRRYPKEKTALISKDLGISLQSVYRKAGKLGLKKSKKFLASPDASRLRRGDNIGALYRFKPGHAPWNKGLKGVVTGGRATQFKPGHKPLNYMPVGSERFSKEGYLMRKMTDTGYPPHDWVPVHILTWVKHNGPVPAGHAIAFKDGNKKNRALKNLECISRGELMKRNSVHNLPKELVQLVQLRGALNRQINRRKKHG